MLSKLCISQNEELNTCIITIKVYCTSFVYFWIHVLPNIFAINKICLEQNLLTEYIYICIHIYIQKKKSPFKFDSNASWNMLLSDGLVVNDGLTQVLSVFVIQSVLFNIASE